MRTALAFVAGVALAVALSWGRGTERQAAERDARAGEAPARAAVDAAQAVVVELDAPPGLPPPARGPARAYDSMAARRQALARTLRDLERDPPEIEAGERDEESVAVVGGAMRDALVRALEGEQR